MFTSNTGHYLYKAGALQPQVTIKILEQAIAYGVPALRYIYVPHIAFTGFTLISDCMSLTTTANYHLTFFFPFSSPHNFFMINTYHKIAYNCYERMCSCYICLFTKLENFSDVIFSTR